nr:snaclec subunit A-like [Lytechinus pictus]
MTSMMTLDPLISYSAIKSEFNTTGPVGLRMELYGCTARVDTVCPEGWSFFQTSCYKVYTEAKSRQAAKTTCANQGAHLATITSIDEQKFLRKFVRAFDMSDYNIGFRRYGKAFRWIDDTFVVYTSWAREEPSYERYKKCVALSKSEDGLWVSVDCDDKIGFVCEYERDSTDLFACGENTVSLHCHDNQKVNITAGDWGRTMDWEVCPQESTFSASGHAILSADTALLLRHWRTLS